MADTFYDIVKKFIDHENGVAGTTRINGQLAKNCFPELIVTGSSKHNSLGGCAFLLVYKKSDYDARSTTNGQYDFYRDMNNKYISKIVLRYFPLEKILTMGIRKICEPEYSAIGIKWDEIDNRYSRYLYDIKDNIPICINNDFEVLKNELNKH
jgi:hypothetical protein